MSAPQRSVKMMLCIDVERRFRTCAEEEEPSEGGSAPRGLPVEEYACDVVCVSGVDVSTAVLAVVEAVVVVTVVVDGVVAVMVEGDVTGILKAIEGREARESRQAAATWSRT